MKAIILSAIVISLMILSIDIVKELTDIRFITSHNVYLSIESNSHSYALLDSDLRSLL